MPLIKPTQSCSSTNHQVDAKQQDYLRMTSGNKRTSASPFRDAADDAADKTSLNSPKQLGENRMPEYTNQGVGSNVLALSQLVRCGDPGLLVDKIVSHNKKKGIADLFVLLFVTRNCRGGKGEKKLSFDIFLRVYRSYPETAKALLPLFPHYGYWKDLLLLMEAAAQQYSTSTNHQASQDIIHTSVTIMKEQFLKDLAAVELYKQSLKNSVEEDKIEKLHRNGPEISLLAKWLPRERSSFDKKLHFVNLFVAAGNVDCMDTAATSKEGSSEDEWQSAAKANYRRQVAELTSYLALPEVLLAAKREEEIRFGKVAARATMLLRKVFINEKKDGTVRSEDPKRIRLAERFLIHVVDKGLKGGQLMPHEIVEKILKNSRISKAEEMVLDAQWKDLWRNVVEQVKTKAAEDGHEAFRPTQMVPLCDVSGSMSGVPMNVAIALSIGISEITHDSFKDRILTFESQPRWHRLVSTASIVQKVRSLADAPWEGSTNFDAAYDLILQAVEDARLDWTDMPLLIVFSDMQFDFAAGTYGTSSIMATMHDNVRRKVQALASRLGWENSDPTPMIYWNLRNTGGHPVDKDSEGAVLLSGFSPSLLKLVMYGEALREEEVEVAQMDGSVVTMKMRVTPEDLLRKMLDDKLYDPVRAVLLKSREGSLLEYESPLAEGLGFDEEKAKYEILLAGGLGINEENADDDFTLV